ncbi:hypothetical protein SAMN05660909_04538 [Chitinophaga terrae (ex Kim and Jung 2007)]|jgi:hypothetical protein|uniref:SxtJ n=2 Tax=Chitinophaga terrae (ex Kim and Jung 2007) TaxID=408074 RepID=A0A1H4FNL9_9BACT|nr:hypothetical protein CTE07_07090 [Chitinophaga terrae (ex Kim and Jung 2007)]SEA98410.1 hypothetical protein SAMN05660909_04538 [Chitinophaga terrae (ex Kim and Jung 2007)]
MPMPVKKIQAMEFGQVAALAATLAGIYYHNWHLVCLAAGCLLVTILAPRLLSPLAKLWSRISEILGVVNVHILLSIVFFLIVLPIGLWRRWRGRDSLLLRQFKKGRESVMVDVYKRYQPEDLKHTF